MQRTRIDNFIIANKCGLSTPIFCLTTKKTDVKRMLKENNKIIVKSFTDDLSIFTQKYLYVNYTKIFTVEDYASLPEEFYPSLFIEYIEKQFEVRTFVFDDIIKSIAVFTQDNEKTKVDMRNYDYSRPNLCVPYKLPDNIEHKLKKLMSVLELTTASLDFVVNNKGEYFLLDVNPFGQFENVDKLGGYNLPYLIAKKIKDKFDK